MSIKNIETKFQLNKLNSFQHGLSLSPLNKMRNDYIIQSESDNNLVKLKNIINNNEKNENVKNNNFFTKTPQIKSIQFEQLENKELNTKFFPSKQIVCKGNSSNKLKTYHINQFSNSPIFQYYADMCKSPSLQNNESRNLNQNFNVSPSNIFNKNSNNDYNNISISNLNKSNDNNNNGTPFLSNGIIRSHTFKIENENVILL